MSAVVQDLTIDLVRRIAAANGFKLKFPLVVVFRKTNRVGDRLEKVTNSGENNTDILLCCEQDRVVVLAKGRSYPHTKYLIEQEQGISQCNYVESQFVRDFWKVGNHIGYTGLVSDSDDPRLAPAVIHRTRDRILDDEDDYIQYGAQGKVGDNCHGFAPYSAGCTTIEGGMSVYPGHGKSTGDWKNVEAWFFGRPDLFSVMWLQYEDLAARNAYRLGSEGEGVAILQSRLGLKDDGIFGPKTFLAVREIQQKNKLPMDGVVTEQIAEIIGNL